MPCEGQHAEVVLLATRLPPYKGLTAAQLRQLQGMSDRLVDLRRYGRNSRS